MSSNIESVDEAKELLADLLDETVRSGVQKLSSDPSHPLENEGAQFFQPMSGTLTEAKTSGPLTTAGAQFLQPIPSTFTEAKTSVPSTNVGTSKHEGEAGCVGTTSATLLPTTSACVGTSVDHLYATKVCKLLSNG